MLSARWHRHLPLSVVVDEDRCWLFVVVHRFIGKDVDCAVAVAVVDMDRFNEKVADVAATVVVAVFADAFFEKVVA